MLARGQALGQEARGKGVNILLGMHDNQHCQSHCINKNSGPTLGPIGRKPRGGRNWEGFGADPVLQAVGGSQTILVSRILRIKFYIGAQYKEDVSRISILSHFPLKEFHLIQGLLYFLQKHRGNVN